MEHTTIAVDLTKSVFQVACRIEPATSMTNGACPAIDSYRSSRSSRRRRSARGLRVRSLLGAAAPTFGHSVRLRCRMMCGHTCGLQPDRSDRCERALEANRNEDIHPVPVKTIEHQAVPSLHRLRSTARRGHAAEQPPRLAARVRYLHPRRGTPRGAAGQDLARRAHDGADAGALHARRRV